MSSPRQVQFDFGGMFQRPPPASKWLMIATAVFSVLTLGSAGGFGDGGLARMLLFSPASVLDRLYLWTPLTYLFIELSPLGLVFHVVFMLWIFGAQVERQWGTRRYLYYLALSTLAGSLLTVLLSMALPSLRSATMSGAYVLSTTILMGWVLSNWYASAYFFFFPVRAPFLLVFTGIFLFLSIVSGQWQPTVPILLSMGVGFLLMKRDLSPRRAYLHFRAWWLERQLRRRARHLRVVQPPEERRGSDKYLH